MKTVRHWTGLQNSELLLVALALSVFWIAAISAIKILGSGYDQKIKGELTTLLQSTDEAIRLWSHEKQAVVENLARDKEVLAVAQELLQTPRTPQALLEAPAQRKARRLFENFLKGGSLRGFFIIGPNNGHLEKPHPCLPR